jgi:AmmeMemoRadiSam system protein A
MLPLNDADQQRLLHLARQALEESVRDYELKEAEEPEGAEARKPLYQTVRECALSAALRDPRFDPVNPEELPHLRLEISVLSPLFDISPDQIEVGRHGLLVSRGSQRGVLLPQVAVEWKWDREQFLEETCMKAGLPPDAWRHGARVQAFTAQAFGAPVRGERSSHHGA